MLTVTITVYIVIGLMLSLYVLPTIDKKLRQIAKENNVPEILVISLATIIIILCWPILTAATYL